MPEKSIPAYVFANLNSDIKHYQWALTVYANTPTKKNASAVKEAYSKVSAAQWELEQYLNGE